VILVDTSVLIEFLRSHDISLLTQFKTLPVSVCGITRAEILHGAKTVADQNRLIIFLNAFIQVRFPEWQWDLLGEFLAKLRANGITVPFNDAAIASLAISNCMELWTRDAQFQLICNVEPKLNLFLRPS
jgi:predicted nucleic acid-binding protein